MKKVFKYELKRSIPFLSILIGVGIIIYLFVLLGSYYITINDFIFFVGFYLFISILILIYYNFSYNKKKKSTDLYYSLPVIHKELFLAKYLLTIFELILIGLIFIFFSYTFLGIMKLGVSFTGEHIYLNEIKLINLFLIEIIQIISSICLMNLFLFLFNRSNTYLDFILYSIIIIFIPKLFLSNIIIFIGKCNYALDYGLYSMLTSWCKYYICNMTDEFYVFNFISCLSITILCGLSFFPLYIYSSNTYAENVELPDKKIFGYKIFIPILSILIIIYFSLNGIFNLILLFILLIVQYTLYALFERTIKINKKDIIVIISTIIIGIIMIFIMS